MKVLLLNGSTRKNGCVYRALSEAASALNDEGIETEILQMGDSPVWDCMGCGFCHSGGNGRCVYEDDMTASSSARQSTTLTPRDSSSPCSTGCSTLAANILNSSPGPR